MRMALHEKLQEEAIRKKSEKRRVKRSRLVSGGSSDVLVKKTKTKNKGFLKSVVNVNQSFLECEC